MIMITTVLFGLLDPACNTCVSICHTMSITYDTVCHGPLCSDLSSKPLQVNKANCKGIAATLLQHAFFQGNRRRSRHQRRGRHLARVHHDVERRLNMRKHAVVLVAIALDERRADDLSGLQGVELLCSCKQLGLCLRGSSATAISRYVAQLSILN